MAEQWIGKGNREDLTPLVILWQSTQRMGLLRRSKGRLLLTRGGLAVADSNQQLWDAVAAALPGHGHEAERYAGTLCGIRFAVGAPEWDGRSREQPHRYQGSRLPVGYVPGVP